MLKKERQEQNQILTLSSVGLMFPISIAIGYYLGSVLDRWFHTGSKLTIFFVVCGIVGAFVNLFKEVAKYNRLTDTDSKPLSPQDEKAESHERQK